MPNATILLVDDDKLIRQFIGQIFEPNDYTVLTASSADEALLLLDTEPNIDLALLDINLPGDDGFTVMDAIQHNPATADARIIMLTGLHDNDIAAKALRAGAVDFVQKPFSVDELLARVQTHLELKQTQDELQQKTAQYRALLAETNDAALVMIENVTEMIVRMTMEGLCLYVSPASEKILGYHPDELIGKPLYTFIHPEDLEHLTAMMPPLLTLTEPSIITVRLRHKNGSYIWLEASIQPTPSRPHERIAVVRDITERKQYEEALRQAYDEMEQRVRERTAELTRINNLLKQEIIDRKRAEFLLEKERAELALRVEESTAELRATNTVLEEANKLKDEFLASMSHELRTPLNAVLGLSESLLEGVYGNINDEQKTALGVIEESGRHLLTLINDILDLSKIGAGKLNLDIQPISVQNVVTASIRFIKQAAVQKHITISTNIDPQIETVNADQRRLKQMLVNLLSNAVKFTDAGGSVGLEVRGNKATNVIQFTVWDTGIGIKEEDLPHLFQPFTQLDRRLSRRYGGTGLGLTLVQRMAEMHGGSISVESKPGEGSRFTISLPWHTPKEASAIVSKGLPETHITPTGKKARILLAEDSFVNLQVTLFHLQKIGYEVLVARNGVEALEMVTKHHPDLVLMDIQMPNMDGLEATRRIRLNPETKRLPIIALTALAMPGDRERCIAAGATDYLSKPIRLKALTQTIEKYLE